MNILVVCHYGLYRDFTSSFVHAQAKAYAALGHRVRVIVPIAIGKQDWKGRHLSAPCDFHNVDGVELCLLRHLSFSNFGKSRANLANALTVIRKNLDKILAGFSPDIIHAHTVGFDSEIGAWLKEQIDVPLVVTVHGSDVSIPLKEGRGAEIKAFCDRADAIVAVSTTLERAIRSCGSRAPQAVILNGYDAAALSEKQEKIPFSILQVGHLTKQKRPNVTMRAFALIHEEHPSSSLTFIGAGNERKPLETLGRELGVLHSVRFTGEISNTRVLEEMGRTQFFVLPSVQEGFGIVYLEAMASGCITIGTEGEGISDFIRNGENGFLIPPDNPEAIAQVIDWCLKHPRESRDIAIQGQHDALSQTWNKNGGEYINLFEGIGSR